MAGRLTTHVLDTMHGKPAAGLRFDLLMLHGDHSHHLISGLTNEDGRAPGPLLEPMRRFAADFRAEPAPARCAAASTTGG